MSNRYLWAKIYLVNWGIAGHEWIVALLKKHVASNKLRHAYLFTGPQGVGKRTMAVRFAQALNCPDFTENNNEPCLVCSACRRIEDMLHADFLVVRSEESSQVLKVDQVRELIHTLALSPYESNYRIALLLQFEEAHSSAANALLKTLEEPSERVIIILTADSAENLLPTVVSRCEWISFRTMTQVKLGQWLVRERKIASQKAELIAHIAAGRPGYALQLCDQEGLLEQRQQFLDDLYQLLAYTRVQRFEYVSSMTRHRDPQVVKRNLRECLLVWSDLWRDVMFCASKTAVPYINLDQLEHINAMSEKFGFFKAQTSLRALQRTLDLLGGNFNPRLAVENLMLQMPYGNIDSPPKG